MPAMQPAKPWAASKNAALASVTCDGRREQLGRDVVGPSRRWRTSSSKLDRPARPDRPVAQQPADDPRARLGRRPEAERRQQVEHDVVVVAGVEGDVVAAGLGDGADHVERLVAVERGDLDRDDALDLGEPPPERDRSSRPAHGRLEVEADERDHPGDGPAVGQQLVVVGVAPAPPRLSRPAW